MYKRKHMTCSLQTQHRLGHINLEMILRMVIGGLISPLDVTALPVCDPYLEEKMTMRPFKAFLSPCCWVSRLQAMCFLLYMA